MSIGQESLQYSFAGKFRDGDPHRESDFSFWDDPRVYKDEFTINGGHLEGRYDITLEIKPPHPRFSSQDIEVIKHLTGPYKGEVDINTIYPQFADFEVSPELAGKIDELASHRLITLIDDHIVETPKPSYSDGLERTRLTEEEQKGLLNCMGLKAGPTIGLLPQGIVLVSGIPNRDEPKALFGKINLKEDGPSSNFLEDLNIALSEAGINQYTGILEIKTKDEQAKVKRDFVSIVRATRLERNGDKIQALNHDRRPITSITHLKKGDEIDFGIIPINRVLEIDRFPLIIWQPAEKTLFQTPLVNQPVPTLTVI